MQKIEFELSAFSFAFLSPQELPGLDKRFHLAEVQHIAVNNHLAVRTAIPGEVTHIAPKRAQEGDRRMFGAISSL
jgi:hypothetical protein